MGADYPLVIVKFVHFTLNQATVWTYKRLVSGSAVK